MSDDHSWAADPTWIKEEQIQSFAGHPLVHRGELQHILERACIVSERGRLKFDHLLEASPAPSIVNAPQAEERILIVAELRDLEVRNIQAALKRTNGKIYGDDGAAALLGMKPTTLVSRIKSLAVEVT